MNSEKIGFSLVVCASLLVAACGGLSDVGKQENDRSPPFADAVLLNHPFTKDASGTVTARVRSGSEVFLSGKDSDGTVAPVLRFDWTLVTQSAVASQVQLITRNESTRSFTAPDVAQDTNLQFRLTVTDSNGQTAQEDVNITVVAIPDANHFLSYNLDDLRKVKVVAATSRAVASAEMQSGDVGFEITVRRLVDYTTPGVDGPYLELDSQVLTGKWLAAYGTGSACEAAPNPNLEISTPGLDLDDILAKVDVRNPDLEPNPALVDTFNVKLQISIRLLPAADAPGLLPADVTPDVCAERVAPAAAVATLAQKVSLDGRRMFAKTGGAAGMVELNLADLIGPPDSTVDTLQSAQAYYASLDPAGERKTFIDWLKVNEFLSADRTSFSWRDLETTAGAHGVYTNNFDLGFGRDMYARLVRCDGAAPQLGQPIPRAAIGTCDIAAVVVNYASLEAASKKLNPVLIVAMEYSKPRDSDHRFVQFYTYAPESVSGRFEQVMSANLDGRGEKYMPQVCTVCHGGTPGGLTTEGVYQNGGDLHATFLPWDLDAFLFSDTEGRNADRSYADDSLRQFYTRAAQAEPLRRLNQVAYLTYHDATRPNRFVLPQQLIEGWYGVQGTSAFAGATFNGDYVPAGWSATGLDGVADTADDNPADAATIYRDVFARHCRMCHVAHTPEAEAGGAQLEQITIEDTTYNTCDSEIVVPGEPQEIGIDQQVPMACYRQFLHAPKLADRLSSGLMPFARLTMDRLWVGGDGTGLSPGAVLREHLGANLGGALPDVPGTPFARISVSPQNADVGDWVSAALTPDSRFVASPAWSVCNETDTGTCDPVPLVSERSTEARFRVPAPGTLHATLAHAAGSVEQSLEVPDAAPSIDTLPGAAGIGQPLTIDKSVVSEGNGAVDDHLWWISDLTNFVATGNAVCTAQAPCRLGDAPQLRLITTLTSIDTDHPEVNRGRFVLHVRDVDVSTTFVTQDVDVTGTLTLVPVTGRVAANAVDALVVNDATLTTLDFRQGNTPGAGETLAIEIEGCPTGASCVTSGRNVRGQDGLASISAANLRYTPPAHYATHPPTGTTLANAPDTLKYRLVRMNGTTVIEQSALATVSIRVRAPVSFEQHVVNDIMKRTTGGWPSGGANCEGCHKPGVGLDAFFNATAATYLRYDWTADEIYQRLQPDSTGRSQFSKAIPTMRYVDLSSTNPLANSAVHEYPSRAIHNGSDRNPDVCPNPPQTCDDLVDLRLWIESGANRF